LSPSVIGPHIEATDLHQLGEGTHRRLYEKLGAHPGVCDGVAGTYFAVWAPNAARVGVTGDFDDWKAPVWLTPTQTGGIWAGFIAGLGPGARYQYCVESRERGARINKSDPFAFQCERPPATASVITALDYEWNDQAWMAERAGRDHLAAPMAIYEVHLGSWRRVPEENHRSLSYRELAPLLAEYVCRLGFSHVGLLPVAEHPFYGSLGYQVTGFFAPTSRYGVPQDFMYLVDTLHQHGIGVLLDWTPAHFPTDTHGLMCFDGTHLYEHADPRQGIHPEWGCAIFDYGRNEVRSFLLSNACFWLDRYHIDGLRVNATASMLYLDHGRKAGEWLPNRDGGRENLEAIALLRACNETVAQEFPGVQTIAEELTAWPNVTRPSSAGGLGFSFERDRGWAQDALAYFHYDPIFRAYHHKSLSARSQYAFDEGFILPLCHDEVAHGKGHLLGQMYGDYWQRFANLRLLYCYLWAQPGKKLLFMGGELGQARGWSHDSSIDWHLATSPAHGKMQLLVGELNRIYREQRSLHELDARAEGFSWIDASDSAQSVLAFLRLSEPPVERVLCVFNFTPVPRRNYRLGVDQSGYWPEILNSDASAFGGSGLGNQGGVAAEPHPSHGRPCSVNLTLPPLGALFLKAPGETSPTAGPTGTP
jgi:1,4-alpha-glucan branching enzyme